ncbi:MAG: DNA topology modulation protein [Leuconostoc pseudomesenteroides]|uniref:DNA topology modulation protein n=1 Tax=Leuconostoc pseudomesenteroides TaxID=33968 RepID=UPI0039E8D035
MKNYNKIMIIGCGGSGKSTLATKLSHKIDVPVSHLDALLWHDNWEMSSKDEQRHIINNVLDKDQWIIDGNYSATLDMRVAKADTIIFIDRSKVMCLYNVVKRYIHYKGHSRPDMHANCPEKIDFEFVHWIWTFNKKRKPAIIEMLADVKHTKNVVVLKSNRQIDYFLKSVQK